MTNAGTPTTSAASCSVAEGSLEELLATFALDDTLLADAYEALGNQGRAIIKKNIARLYDIWGELPAKNSSTQSFRQGFTLSVVEAPAPFAFVVCPAEYVSPAALVGAVLPPFLAGVMAVYPFFITAGGAHVAEKGGAPSFPLLGALEIAGAERAFYGTEDDAIQVAQALFASYGKGRCVLLGDAAYTARLNSFAHQNAVPCASLTGTPRYFSRRLAEVVPNVFSAASSSKQGSVMPSGSDAGSGTRKSACASARTGEACVSGGCCSEDDAFLNLDAAHEQVWIWPELSPAWFRVRRMSLAQG